MMMPKAADEGKVLLYGVMLLGAIAVAVLTSAAFVAIHFAG